MPFRSDRERRACFAKINTSVPRVRTTVSSRKKLDEDSEDEVDEDSEDDEED